MQYTITKCQNPNLIGEVGELTGTTFQRAVSRDELVGFEPVLGTQTYENPRGTVLTPVAGAFAFKADGGKPNWFLLMSGKGCAAALAGVVRVLSFAVRPVAEGGKGYTEHSWRQVPNARERYEAAMYRHLNKIALGEDVDDESGESHWDHVATNALFLSELTKAGM